MKKLEIFGCLGEGELNGWGSSMEERFFFVPFHLFNIHRFKILGDQPSFLTEQ